MTRIGVPTEIKADEYRVAVTPAGVREMSEHGHEILVQAGFTPAPANDISVPPMVGGTSTVPVQAPAATKDPGSP